MRQRESEAPKIERFNPRELSTDTLRNMTSSFEREWQNAIISNPEKSKYDTLGFVCCSVGEINYLLSIGAIRIRTASQTNKEYIAVVPLAYDTFKENMSALDELNRRRNSAQKMESLAPAPSIPFVEDDEIKIEDISF